MFLGVAKFSRPIKTNIVESTHPKAMYGVGDALAKERSQWGGAVRVRWQTPGRPPGPGRAPAWVGARSTGELASFAWRRPRQPRVEFVAVNDSTWYFSGMFVNTCAQQLLQIPFQRDAL